jgi:hypothetical protein
VEEVSLRLHACIIRAEGFDTDADGDYLDVAVNFDLSVGNEVHRGLVARVKLAAGSTFADPFEVLPPSRWVGDFDYERYRACIERYVREQVLSEIGDHRMTHANIRIRDVRIAAEATCTLATAASDVPPPMV